MKLAQKLLPFATPPVRVSSKRHSCPPPFVFTNRTELTWGWLHWRQFMCLFDSRGYGYWKCNFPMTPHTHLLGRSVCLSEFLSYWEIMTDRPTDRVIEKVTIPARVHFMAIFVWCIIVMLYLSLSMLSFMAVSWTIYVCRSRSLWLSNEEPSVSSPHCLLPNQTLVILNIMNNIWNDIGVLNSYETQPKRPSF